ncbi:MAG: DUF3365 domain-containing protein [Arcobacter sp.]|nr:DUF3365 domain-containing protein [Arcobacter sp.]
MKNIKYAYIAIFMLFSTIILALYSGNNKTILEDLKSSAKKVIKNNQKLFNTNKDGSTYDKRFSAERFSQMAYNQFKILSTGESWKIRDLKKSNDQVQLSRALSLYMAAARMIVAQNQFAINTDEDGSRNPKRFYPAVFGDLTAMEFKKKTGIEIRQTKSEGHHGSNSKYSEPDKWEKKVLNNLKKTKNKRNVGFGETTKTGGKDIFRYVMPLHVKKVCLACHINSGFKLNETRGAISIKMAK